MSHRWIGRVWIVVLGASTFKNVKHSIITPWKIGETANHNGELADMPWASNATEFVVNDKISASSAGQSTYSEYRSFLQSEWRKLDNESHFTIPNIVLRTQKTQQHDVTVAVHLSPKKLYRFYIMSQRWGGPVSASVYISKEEDISEFLSFVETNEHELSHVSFHVIMEKTTMDYCHNKLRQLAIKAVDTEYFLILDVDFVTMPKGHVQLRSLIATDRSLRSKLHSSTMMVLPAFSREVNVTDEDLVQIQDKILPASRDDAKDMVKHGYLKEFHLKRFFAGHGPTNFPKWLSDNEIDSFYSIDYDLRFEPYVLAHVQDIPRFWKGFRGFGYNKWSFYLECHLRGFRFAVLRDFFVVHLDHPTGLRRQSKHNHKQMKKFKKHLLKKYGAAAKNIEFLS